MHSKQFQSWAVTGQLGGHLLPAFILSVLCILCSAQAGAQVLVSATPIVERDVDWLRSNGVPNALYGVRVWKITYQTPAVNGAPSLASAAYVDPINSCVTPLLCYIHGTAFLKSDVPSRWEEGNGGARQGYAYGSQGVACILPDLLGLGDSPGLHPYLHAASEASACMDAVRAAREFREQHGGSLGEQLFLLGVSAGAHACLATAQAMQTDYAEEFHITAAAGIDGPYAVFPVIKDEMTDDQADQGAANLVYILLAYNEAYPGLFSSVSDFLVPPYNTEIPPLYDGYHTKEQIEPLLPDTFSILIPEALEQEVETNPSSPLNLRFKENTVFNWAPEFPMKLYYCTSDLFVLPQNTQLALAGFQAHGAADVSAIIPSGDVDHGDCALLSQPMVYEWFLAQKASCDGSFGPPPAGDFNFSLVPNPSEVGSTLLQFGPGNEGDKVLISVANLLGQTVMNQYGFCDGYNTITLDTHRLEPGTYIVQSATKEGRHGEKLVLVR